MVAEGEKLFTADNRSFRYGDGVFETIKVYKGRILFEDYHFERLFLSLKMLQVENGLRTKKLSAAIIELCQKNECTELARVRLAVYRNENNHSEYAIEALPLSREIKEWNENGLTIGIYPYLRKTPDAFSNLKTANFLPYVMAERYSKEMDWDDAIVLNTNNFLADTSKANIFLVKKNNILTPALHQGCINGVMRKFLIDEMKRIDYKVIQAEISEQDLLDADEVFVTNSILDLKWVKAFKNKNYSAEKTFSIHQQLISPMYT